MDVLAFLGISLLVIVTPGQDTALTIQNTVLGGRRAGAFTALGVSAGQATWTLAASAGVAAIVVAWEPAFLAIKLAGAAYLVYLGVHALYEAVRPDQARTQYGTRALAGVTPAAALRQGLLSNLGNPKMAAFFTSLLPQFVPAGDASFWSLLGLGLSFCALTLAWLVGYAVVVARTGDLLRGSRARRLLNAVMGTVMVGLGIRLAVSER